MLILVAGGGALALSLLWPAARISADPLALAGVKLAPAGEHVTGVEVLDGRERPVAVHLRSGSLWPTGKIPAGETLRVRVTVRRSGWVSWLVGRTEHVDAVVRTPVARLETTILRPRAGEPVALRFDAPVGVVTFSGHGTAKQRLVIRHPRPIVQTGYRAAGRDSFGTITVTSAARPWEKLSPPVQLSWFTAGTRLQALVRPAPNTSIAPTAPITLTFSQPIADTLGSARPTLDPPTPGTWAQTSVNKLTFRPAGEGFALGKHISLTLPVPTDVVVGGRARTLSSLAWQVPAGSTLRLEQLLSELGYLPLAWKPAHGDVPRTSWAQAEAAVSPPDGSFTWRYPNTPPSLQALWKPGGWTRMTQGAVMAFQHDQGLTVDGIPGPHVWHALIAATLQPGTEAVSYSYVLVHRNVPQTLVLWHDGKTVLDARVNTGVPAAPTPYGTHAVFLHIESGTMRGTNPDGSHYVDPGIRWISYFYGGEAIHGFNRASYGFPQSVGCVEAPIETAAKIWPYTPIGTLVTVVP